MSEEAIDDVASELLLSPDDIDEVLELSTSLPKSVVDHVEQIKQFSSIKNIVSAKDQITRLKVSKSSEQLPLDLKKLKETDRIKLLFTLMTSTLPKFVTFQEKLLLFHTKDMLVEYRQIMQLPPKSTDLILLYSLLFVFVDREFFITILADTFEAFRKSKKNQNITDKMIACMKITFKREANFTIESQKVFTLKLRILKLLYDGDVIKVFFTFVFKKFIAKYNEKNTENVLRLMTISANAYVLFRKTARTNKTNARYLSKSVKYFEELLRKYVKIFVERASTITQLKEFLRVVVHRLNVHYKGFVDVKKTSSELATRLLNSITKRNEENVSKLRAKFVNCETEKTVDTSVDDSSMFELFHVDDYQQIREIRDVVKNNPDLTQWVNREIYDIYMSRLCEWYESMFALFHQRITKLEHAKSEKCEYLKITCINNILSRFIIRFDKSIPDADDRKLFDIQVRMEEFRGLTCSVIYSGVHSAFLEFFISFCETKDFNKIWKIVEKIVRKMYNHKKILSNRDFNFVLNDIYGRLIVIIIDFYSMKVFSYEEMKKIDSNLTKILLKISHQDETSKKELKNFKFLSAEIFPLISSNYQILQDMYKTSKLREEKKVNKLFILRVLHDRMNLTTKMEREFLFLIQKHANKYFTEDEKKRLLKIEKSDTEKAQVMFEPQIGQENDSRVSKEDREKMQQEFNRGSQRKLSIRGNLSIKLPERKKPPKLRFSEVTTARAGATAVVVNGKNIVSAPKVPPKPKKGSKFFREFTSILLESQTFFEDDAPQDDVPERKRKGGGSSRFVELSTYKNKYFNDWTHDDTKNFFQERRDNKDEAFAKMIDRIVLCVDEIVLTGNLFTNLKQDELLRISLGDCGFEFDGKDDSLEDDEVTYLIEEVEKYLKETEQREDSDSHSSSDEVEDPTAGYADVSSDEDSWRKFM